MGAFANQAPYSPRQHLGDALEGWGDRPYFSPEKARALYKKSQILQLQNKMLLARGTALNAERTWREWFRQAHGPIEPFPAKIDYDEYVPFWSR